MERLTERDEDGYIHKIGECSLVDCYNKLGELENIEQEIGLSLKIVFKILKHGIWGWGEDAIFHFKPEELYLDLKQRTIKTTWECWDLIFPFSNYGYSWAINKEEIYNESKNGRNIKEN